MSKPQEIKWVHANPPPAIGSKVSVRVNRIGDAEVLAYFSQEEYMGIKVQPLAPPEWYVKQNGNVPCFVFGPEVGY